MRKVLFLVVLALMVFAPMAMAQDATPAADLIPVSIVLKWVPQAQFAGYYAAAAQGYYTDEGLDVTIVPAGTDINPQQYVAAGTAQFGTDWMGNMLATRDAGQDVIAIAQIYQRSGMRQITWKDSNLTTFADLKGKTVGVWPGGNAFPTFAALTKEGIDPENSDDVTIAQQAFDMNAFLNKEIDAASAMTYNEIAQVLETTDADGKLLYTPDDLNVLDFNTEGTAMLEDLIFTNAAWLAEGNNQETAIKFLRASFRGWIECRDNPDACVDAVLAAGPTLGKGHQEWQMNEVNKLIWPSPDGIGIMDADAFATTAKIALDYKIITKAADGEGSSYRNDLAQAALDSLQADMPALDLKGTDWKAPTVEITPGGE
jgi:NitT/TauT family transport system substrate-binding protein